MGKPYAQIGLDERIELSRHHDGGTAPSENARIMGHYPSTIGREPKRNSLPEGGNEPASADRIALSRRCRMSRIKRLSPLRHDVRDHLSKSWSPEQIAGRIQTGGISAQGQPRFNVPLHLPPATPPLEPKPTIN